MNKTKQFNGVTILPKNTRVFIKDPFLIKRTSSKVGLICGWSITPIESTGREIFQIEYQLIFPNGIKEWIKETQMSGYLFGV